MQALLLSLSLIVYFDSCFPCALPYWWNEQFHFPPFYPSGQPKTTYKYVETLHHTDPNNYVRIQEYSEYTWWENVPFKTNGPGNFGHDGNNYFVKDFGIHPHVPPNSHSPTNNIVPRGDPHVPPNSHSPTNNIVPRGDPHVPPTSHSPTNNIVPRGDPEPADTNNMIPTDKTDRVSPELETDDSTTSAETPTDDLERNENEQSSRLENAEENELEAGSESKKGLNFLSGWFGSKNSNETEPCQVSGSDIHSMRGMIEKMFSFPRELPENKEKARQDIMNKFKELGLQVWTQNFTTPPTKNENGTLEPKEGVNLVGVIPGAQRGHLDDQIVLVGAHYDTVADSKGVDDNGSGLAVMLEIARTIMEARCRLNNTLMFVAFDHEENGAMGSNYFVDHYLIPEELKRARARFQGAFILDGILNYNDVPNTQELPLDYAESLPGLQYFVNHTGNRGNFLAMISRHEMDAHLSKKLMDAWQDLGADEYKLFNLAVDMGNEIPPLPVIEKHLNFLRSDHATFWYHNSSSHFPESLNAVLLTDTGPFRGQMKECYHSECDDLTVMSPEKLQFAKKTADALTATLVELTRATAAGYRIQPPVVICILLALVLPYTLRHLFLQSV